MDNEKHYLPKVLRKRDCYQNGNSHFCTIKRYDCLVGDQNDHQLKSVRYGWVVSGQLVHLPLFTMTWQNVKSRSAVTRTESMCLVWTHWIRLRQFTSCRQIVHMRWAVTHKVFLVNDSLCHSPHQLAILTSWYWVRRSPCMAFLPPSSGVFRLSFSGSSPCIPCRRSCGFQGSLLILQ